MFHLPVSAHGIDQTLEPHHNNPSSKRVTWPGWNRPPENGAESSTPTGHRSWPIRVDVNHSRRAPGPNVSRVITVCHPVPEIRRQYTLQSLDDIAL